MAFMQNLRVTDVPVFVDTAKESVGKKTSTETLVEKILANVCFKILRKERGSIGKLSTNNICLINYNVFGEPVITRPTQFDCEFTSKFSRHCFAAFFTTNGNK